MVKKKRFWWIPGRLRAKVLPRSSCNFFWDILKHSGTPKKNFSLIGTLVVCKSGFWSKSWAFSACFRPLMSFCRVPANYPPPYNWLPELSTLQRSNRSQIFFGCSWVFQDVPKKFWECLHSWVCVQMTRDFQKSRKITEKWKFWPRQKLVRGSISSWKIPTFGPKSRFADHQCPDQAEKKIGSTWVFENVPKNFAAWSGKYFCS